MTTLFQSLFVVLRGDGDPLGQLAAEDLVLDLAAKVGKAIHTLATIVSPGTILPWIRESQG